MGNQYNVLKSKDGATTTKLQELEETVNNMVVLDDKTGKIKFNPKVKAKDNA